LTVMLATSKSSSRVTAANRGKRFLAMQLSAVAPRAACRLLKDLLGSVGAKLLHLRVGRLWPSVDTLA
jgi:hypothetical protein